MSVLVKGMTMPKCCAMCPMCHRNFDWRKPRLACYALSAWCVEDEDRLEKCPLVELPEKHGRLIDADKLMRDINKYHVSDGKFQHWVEVQPTVIEAEDE